MAFSKVLPQRRPISQINNYVHFYEFGDSGGTLIEDSGPGAQELINSTSPASVQVTDALQGEVAEFVQSAGFTNMGFISGNVDKSFTALINSDAVNAVTLFHSSVDNTSFDLISPTKLGPFNGTEALQFDVPSIAVDESFWFGMSITSDFKYRLYKNGIESSTGELQGTVTLFLDKFSDFFDFQYVGFGGKIRIYDKVLSAADFLSIDKRDRKVA